MKIFKHVTCLSEFTKDIKRLSKKFNTIDSDLDVFIKKQLNLYHKLNIDNKGVVQIPGLKIDYPKIYKGRKFACRSLRGKGSQSGIRVIYAYFEKEDKVELIEIYYKGNKENENRERIMKYYGKT